MDLLIDKSSQLEDLKQQIILDRVCPELAVQANQLVFGYGHSDSKLVFIGEAPGKQEDQTGIPFVGAAGKFLDELLASVNLFRKDVYITNIVKYRPPENRDPTFEEKQAFMPYLCQELRIIQPKLVITLGRHPASCFLPTIKISQEHGKLKQLILKSQEDKLKIILLPLYHPAAALYNGSMRQTLIDDFKQIGEIISANRNIYDQQQLIIKTY